jgi:hypothetical protein
VYQFLVKRHLRKQFDRLSVACRAHCMCDTNRAAMEEI